MTADNIEKNIVREWKEADNLSVEYCEHNINY